MYRARAKQIVTIVLGSAFSIGVDAADCDDRMVNISAPIFPTSLQAQRTVALEGPCSVLLNYELSESGVPQNVTVVPSEERCRPFYRASINALNNSDFSVGSYLPNCAHTFIFQLDEDI